MVQFMTAREQVDAGHHARGEPTYAELQVQRDALLAALEALMSEINPPTPGSIGETRINMVYSAGKAAIAKAKGGDA